MNFNINNRDAAAMSFYLKNRKYSDLLFLLKEIITAQKYGMEYVSKKTGLCRTSLYQVLDVRGNPRIDNLINILDAIGLQLFCPQLNTVITIDQPERLNPETPKGDAIVRTSEET